MKSKYIITTYCLFMAAAASGGLTLEQAVTRAIMTNPELQALELDVRAAEARADQAAAMRNPKIEFEVEEYDRNGEGFDSTEQSIGIQQWIELGRKRTWRGRVADAEGVLAGWDLECRRLDIFSETGRRFMAVMAAEKHLAISSASADLAGKSYRAVKGRVDAGKEPPLQASKAAAELEIAKIDAAAAAESLKSARKNLAAMWGSDEIDFEDLTGRLEQIEPAPSIDKLRAGIAGNPNVARWDDEIRLRRTALASEKAKRMPDIQGKFALQNYEEDGSDAIAFGIGVNLPVFNRNRGGISAARHDLASIVLKRKAAAARMSASLSEAHTALVSAHRKAEVLKKKVIPAMEEAFNAAQEGYSQGKFNFMDLLDAQRSLFETRTAQVDALLEYHIASAQIQKLTGSRVGDITK